MSCARRCASRLPRKQAFRDPKREIPKTRQEVGALELKVRCSFPHSFLIRRCASPRASRAGAFRARQTTMDRLEELAKKGEEVRALASRLYR